MCNACLSSMPSHGVTQFLFFLFFFFFCIKGQTKTMGSLDDFYSRDSSISGSCSLQWRNIYLNARNSWTVHCTDVSTKQFQCRNEWSKRKTISKTKQIHRKHSFHTRYTLSTSATSSIPKGVRVEPVIGERNPGSFSFLVTEKGKTILVACLDGTKPGTRLPLWTDQMWMQKKGAQTSLQRCCSSPSDCCTVKLRGTLQSRLNVHICVGDYIRNCLPVKVTAIKSINRCGEI